jgi:hypothetical protein
LLSQVISLQAPALQPFHHCEDSQLELESAWDWMHGHLVRHSQKLM